MMKFKKFIGNIFSEPSFILDTWAETNFECNAHILYKDWDETFTFCFIYMAILFII